MPLNGFMLQSAECSRTLYNFLLCVNNWILQIYPFTAKCMTWITMQNWPKCNCMQKIVHGQIF